MRASLRRADIVRDRGLWSRNVSTMTSDRRRTVRRLGRVAWVLVVLVAFVGVGFVGFGLGKRTLEPAPAVPVSASPVTVVAAEGTLVDERPLSVQAAWGTSW